MAATLHPPVLWAQRHDTVIVTIDLQDSKDPAITIENDEAAKAGRIKFSGKAHSHATGPEEHTYELDLELYDEIDADDVKQARTDRTITLAIAKKDAIGPHWPRLLKAAGKPPSYVKVDWDRWVDEDEEAEEDAASMAGFEQFQGMGGMPPGMGGGDMGGMMGGMPGMGGDMGGGMPGMGGMDMQALMAQLGQSGGGGMAGMPGGFGGEEGEEGSGEEEEEDLPPLEPGSIP